MSSILLQEIFHAPYYFHAESLSMIGDCKFCTFFNYNINFNHICPPPPNSLKILKSSGDRRKILSNICFSYIAERRFQDPEIRCSSNLRRSGWRRNDKIVLLVVQSELQPQQTGGSVMLNELNSGNQYKMNVGLGIHFVSRYEVITVKKCQMTAGHKWPMINLIINNQLENVQICYYKCKSQVNCDFGKSVHQYICIPVHQ